MWPICKKELRQFFSSLTGYIAIIVFLAVNGLVLFVLRNNILESGYATLDQFFSFAPWVLLFLVSAITMRSFSDEFRSGTFEILQTRPLSNGQIVGGKFWGSYLVALIALLPTLVYYFTINHLAATMGIDAGAAVGSYLGLALLTGVFTAIGVCVSSFTTNSVVSFIITLISSLLIYYGFSAISELALFQSGADYYLELLGIDFHYQSISKGVIDSRDVIYFLSVILFFLFITRIRLSREARAGKTKATGTKWLGALVALLLLNFVAAKFHSRADLTEEGRYSLTKATRNLTDSLQNNVTIDVFLKGEYPSGFRKLSNTTQEFLSVLKETAPSRISYRFISPDEEAGNGKTWGDSLRSMGVEPINLTVQVKAGEENKFIFPYAFVSGNGKTEIVNLFPSSRRSISPAELNNAEAMMEYGFANAIDRLKGNKRPAVAYALGHGEPEGPETFSLQQTIDPERVSGIPINPKYFESNTSSLYRFGVHNILEWEVIPSTIDVLMIVKPSTTFSEADKLKIDQYIMQGGKVIWFLDNLYAEQDSLAFKPDLIAYDRNLNLNDLLFNYGVRINTDLIMDLQCDFLKLIVGGTEAEPQYEYLQWNYWPFLDPNNNHSISKNLGLVAGRFINSIDTVEANGITKTYLLQTSSNSRIISTPARISLNENKTAPTHELFQKDSIPSAVLLEGQFSSLYKNRIGSAQRDSLRKFGGFLETSRQKGKIIVVADGDIVLNDVHPEEGPLPMGKNRNTIGSRYEFPAANRAFLLNCLEYLTGKESIISTRNKEIVLRLLDIRKVEAEKGKWSLINIALPILLVIVFGVIYQRIRRYRAASL